MLTMAPRSDPTEELRQWFASKEVATWRKDAGLTQEQAAQRIGVSVGTYSRWERGTQSPKGLVGQVAHTIISEWRSKSGWHQQWLARKAGNARKRAKATTDSTSTTTTEK